MKSCLTKTIKIEGSAGLDMFSKLARFFLGQNCEATTKGRGSPENSDRCYTYFYDKLLTWDETKIECRKFGPTADLASFETQGEADFLKGLMQYVA